MKVLVVGSGGREHALCWKLAQSDKVSRVYCAPGNPGTAALGENVPVDPSDFGALAEFVQSNTVDLTVVGPEQPLSDGIVDLFRERGLRIFGPSKAAARLESSKHFAKEIMCEAGVPTAGFEVFTGREAAQNYVRSASRPVVLKADCLAAGKGVFVCQSERDIELALEGIFNRFKSGKVLVEECLMGKEASYIVATDGRTVVPMASSHDYKRLREGQQGPNTGGMGTVSPTFHLLPEQEKWVLENVMTPVILEMERRGTPFRGFLYAGLMISERGDINVLEFNVRMGDPECQPIMRRMDFDLFELLYGLCEESGNNGVQVKWKADTSVCVVLAAAGYPEEARTGDAIRGLEAAANLPGIEVFHAGTGIDRSGVLVTKGGRVLGVTSLEGSLDKAIAAAYEASGVIEFEGRQMRRDIGV